MIVLGISDNHDSGAAIVKDGALVAAVNQERIDRVKGSSAFPFDAIDEVMRISGVKTGEVDHIAVGTGFTPSAILRAAPAFHRNAKVGGQFSPLLHGYILYQSAIRATNTQDFELSICKRIIRHKLKSRRLQNVPITLTDHHTAHSEGAYRTQQHDRCLVFTLDAMGDGTTATVSLGQDGQLSQIWRQNGLASVNTFYSRVTQKLGFIANRHEGKVTGMAALATAPIDLVKEMTSLVYFRGDGFSSVSPIKVAHQNDSFWSKLDSYTREEVAASAQLVLEEAVTKWIGHWVKKAKCADIALSGGLFANVKLNQRIAAISTVRSLWVMPHMGDGGLAAGAAMAIGNVKPSLLDTALLGPEYSVRDMYMAIGRGELPQEKPLDPAMRAAQVIADGGVVGCFQGQMEWGPRALGARSIIASPKDSTINDTLNKRLSRSEFMPFAPIIRAEDSDKYLASNTVAFNSSRFMTVSMDATQQLRQDAPAAVHVDNTARPQLVDMTNSPHLYQLLCALEQLGQPPVAINTSFNLHEEPIVCTPSDAVRAFKKASLEALWMGPFFVET